MSSIPAQNLLAIAEERAAAHELDRALVCAIVEQESGWDKWSIRFEEGFYKHYIESMSLTPTEAYARAFSYGLMQIMGQTARELGFSEKYLSELCEPFLGVHYGCLKLKQCLSRSKGNVETALSFYNGGSNTDYAPQVIKRMSRYQ